jgi:hypothetical protein
MIVFDAPPPEAWQRTPERFRRAMFQLSFDHDRALPDEKLLPRPVEEHQAAIDKGFGLRAGDDTVQKVE